MPIARTAKGTAQSKATTALTLASVKIAAGASVIVCVASLATVPSSVTWNGQNLTADVLATTNPGVSIYSLHNVAGATGSVVVNFSVSSVCSFTVSEVTGLAGSAIDKTKVAQNLTGSTAPSSGGTTTTAQSDEILIGAITSNGPSSDASGTWSNLFQVGQRVGNTGGSATSNSTISEGFRIVGSTGIYTAAKTGITSRKWAAAIATYKMAPGAIVIAPGTFTRTGVAVGLRRTRLLTAAAGTFTRTGVAVGLAKTRIMAAGPGSFSEAGVAVGLSWPRSLQAIAGSYLEAGVAAAFARPRAIVIAPGAFLEAGVAAGLVRSRLITAVPGSFLEAGIQAGLLRQNLITATAGHFLEAGIAQGLYQDQRILIAPGSFTRTGIAAPLYADRRTPIAPGSFTVAGSIVNTLRGRRIAAELGFLGAVGTNTPLFANRAILGAPGGFINAGALVNLIRSRALDAEAGSYLEAGIDAVLAGPGQTFFFELADGRTWVSISSGNLGAIIPIQGDRVDISGDGTP